LAGWVGSEGEARGELEVDFEGKVDKLGHDLLGEDLEEEDFDTHLELDYMRGLQMQQVAQGVAGKEGHRPYLQVVEVVLPHPWRPAVHKFVRPVSFAEVERPRAE